MRERNGLWVGIAGVMLIGAAMALAQNQGMRPTERARDRARLSSLTDIETLQAQATALGVATGRLDTAMAAELASLTVSTTALSDTQATVTVTCKNAYGDTLAAAKAFPFWWSTVAVSSVATTNGVELFNLTKGSIRRYDYNASSEVCAYLVESDADGTVILTATCDSGPFTNVFHAVVNGAYTNLAVPFLAP